MPTLTAQQIAQAKREVDYSLKEDVLHEHDDCVRIAYEWLDAQKKLKAPRHTGARPLKHIIERWGNRYISQSDVEVAAHLHPDITGRYPYYNISARLIEPSYTRLARIGEANKHDYASRRSPKTYAAKEIV